MRLTLRTLLAYVDDILEPSQAREIGQKIKESAVARELLNRIREVVRRRRLSAPDVDGPDMGLDPNTVAEYLDNTLSPTGVADVERVCLESDVHLAEVAACHQILTLVLGEPVEIPVEKRERVYALGPLTRPPQLEIDGNGQPVAAEEPARPQIPTPQPPAPSDAEFESRIPDYLRDEPGWKRYAPFGLVGIVALVWMALVYFDPTLNPFRASGPTEPAVGEAEGPATADGVVDGADAGNASTVSGGDSDDTTTVKPDANPGEAVAVAGVPAGALPPGDGINPAPPAEEPGTEPKPPTEVAALPPGAADPGEVGVTPKPPVPEPGPAAVVEPKPPVGPPGPGEEPKPVRAMTGLVYEADTGVLLHATESMGETVWKTMPKRSIMYTTERLACPEPYEAPIAVQDDIAVVVHGGSRLMPREAPRGAGISAEIERGRVVFSRVTLDPDVEPKPVVNVEIVVHGRRYALQLVPDTKCAVEVGITGPTGYEEAVDPERFPAAVYLVTGECRIVALDRAPSTNADGSSGRTVTLSEPNSAVSLVPAEWPAVVPGMDAVKPVPVQMAVLPDWLSGTRRLLSSVLRRARVQFEREFGLSETVVASIEPTIRDPDPMLSEYAVQALWLVEDVSSLVNALATAPHPEARSAALEGLREWLAMHPDEESTAQLREELNRYFQADVAAEAYRLLWGYDIEDARDPVVSQHLVNLLSHDTEAIRHLAFFHVRRLTGKDFYYLPHKPPVQRKVAVRTWQRYIDDRGALLATDTNPTP